MTETYIAEHVWLIANAAYANFGKKLETPKYLELVHPSLIKHDTRTAEQIKQDIVRKLVG